MGLIRKAKVTDVKEISSLIEGFANNAEMLHRPLTDLYSNIRDFFVYKDDGVVLGACALHVCWEDLGEIKSLAVREDETGKGIGRQLVGVCLDEARELALEKVFALTYRAGFFEKLGFELIDKSVLPHKIWSECVRCFKFPNCDESAVLVEL